MKIGILTLPLHTNYGGVLQAYALQYSLHCMGHEAYLIDCRQDPRYANIIKKPTAEILAFAAKVIPPLQNRLKPLERQMRADKVLMRHNIEEFISKYIPLRHYWSYNSIPSREFDAIVVGSDQVWRPAYFPGAIQEAYLKFAHKWDIRRVAYATSFGVDNWEYSDSQTKSCKKLISIFDAVSLREESGVELTRQNLQREACCVLDPTLLLPRREYFRLVEEHKTEPSNGDLLVSLLDHTIDKIALIKTLASGYSAKPFYTNSKVEDRTADIEERIQPPIQKWLRGFMDAKYVVTDSYHATIFAIIFNKPFVVYGNRERGYARFTSLLSSLGLERQFISSTAELDLENCFNIEWDKVNEKLEQLRESSRQFLRQSLKCD